MSRSKEKKEPKASQIENQSSRYELVNLGIGLAGIFISALALFGGGIVGRLLTNTVLLFVGQIYWLLFILLGIWGGYLVLRGRFPKLGARFYMGVILVIVALTTILHVNRFSDRQPQEILGVTYQTFIQNISAGQGQTGLGGGMLGSLFYWAFGSLFGKWGTYLFSSLLLLVGCLLVLPLSLAQIRYGIYRGFMSMKNKLGQVIPTWSEMKEVFNQTEEDTDDFEGKYHPDFKEDTNQSRSKKNKSSSIGGARLFSKRKDDPEREQDYQPAFTKSKRQTFEPFDVKQNPTINRIARETKILDLDYFDQVEEKKGHVGDSVKEVEIINSTGHNLGQYHEESQEIGKKVERPAIELDEMGNQSVEREEASENKQSESQITAKQAAGHWQEQANQKQDLTENQVDEILGQDKENNRIQPKKSQGKLGLTSLKLPGKNLLKKIPPVDQSEEYARINENIEKLERTFESFGVKAKVVRANLGPSVTKYEIEPAIGVKVSKIVSLSDDIALALAARDVRMEAPIPGKSLIGIEVPNTQVSPVSFWEIIDAALESKNLLEVPLGRDISGSVCLADLTKMPHLLIAGATGSGKSVGMNVIIVSLLMKCQPDQVKFLMIDPKKVELTMYDDLPHLLTPVVTNPRKAAQALNKVVQEMERRYELFASSNVRNIDSYNEMVDQWNQESADKVYEKLPKIVVFVDELADLMMVASNDVESAIIRLAQMARAAGIHMIIATQRPSVDVITGIIKANVPSRLAFAVSSGTDSRTILDSVGAEKLLGRGDMLFQPIGKNKPVRVQGAYISDAEVERITDFIKDQAVADYEDSLIQLEDDGDGPASISEDEYFQEAAQMLEGMETISISQLQRRFRIGYNRAARLIDDMEAAGLVSAPDGSKPRQVL